MYRSRMEFGGYLLVLIDTWWNVNNFDLTSTGAFLYGFNRYMVECE